MDKETIFENIEQYNAQDLADFVKQGVVTLEELKDPDNVSTPLRASVRKELEKILDNADPDAWAQAKLINTKESYQSYLDMFSYGKYRESAREAKMRIEEEEDRISNEKREKEQAVKDAERKSIDRNVFEQVDKNSKRALEDFISSYPNNLYVGEAEKLLFQMENDGYTNYGMKGLKEDIANAQTDKTINDPNQYVLELIGGALDNKNIEVADLLDEIYYDNNFLNAWVVRELVNDNRFTYKDLEDCGIDYSFIEKLAKEEKPCRFDTPKPIEKFSRTETTEIYFWGIPSSGKSCAIGAILSVADNGKIAKTMNPDGNCQGYEYMNKLPMCFQGNGEICSLPEGTPVSSTYEMGFDLIDNKNKNHPITCIDFAGELIKCMFKVYAQKTLSTQEANSLQTLANLLIYNRTNSRKIHFFVVEYGAEERKYEGLPQKNYLQSAITYLKNLKDEKGRSIFKTSTDAIYLVITKVDKLKAPKGADKSILLQQHVKDHYLSFYNGLKQICEENQINGGQVPVLPFSLGKVCFQNYCKFKDAYAASIVDIILKRSYGKKIGKGGLFEKLLQG